MKFHERLRQLRDSMDMTQPQFSQALHAESYSYAPIEQDGRPFGMKFFKRFAEFFKRIGNHKMLLSLLEHCGVDLAFLADTVKANQWHYPPELPPAPGKDYEGKPCGDSPYVQILHNRYGYPHIEGGWYDHIEQSWFVFSGDVVTKENVFGWQYWLKVPLGMIAEMEVNDDH